MRVLWVVSCFAQEQPTPPVWREVAAVADAWSQATGVALGADQPYLRMGALDSEAARDALVDALREVPGAVINVGASTRLDEQDFASAEYVGVFPDAERVTVANVELAQRASGPCPRCGLQDSFDVVQLAPFGVADDTVAGDVSALPAGGMAISARVVGLLAGRSGWSGQDILLPSGSPSANWFQLVSDRCVWEPCNEHTRILGEPFCSVCGRAQGDVVGYFWVRSDARLPDIFTRHPVGRAMFYLRRDVLAGLSAAGVAGLVPGDVVRVCRHGG